MQERIEELEEQILQLKSELGAKMKFSPKLGLTKGQSAILGLMVRRGYVTQSAVDAISKGAQPIRHAIWMIRCKLRPFGIEFHTQHAQHYYIDKENIQKLLDMNE